MSEMTAPRFGSLTLDGFIQLLGSSAPSPGGGAASAVAASCGAALVAMVASLSVDRPKYAMHAASHARRGAAGRVLAARLLALADEDADAYAAFAAALKLPRETDAEKAVRTAAIRASARLAAEAPLRTLEACRDIVTGSEGLAGRSNLNAASDLAVASRLAEAAAHGAAENVIVNLPSLGDDELADEMRGRVEALLAEIEELANATRAQVERGELRDPESNEAGPAVGGTGVEAGA
jgi:glutamate formiminotransferase/formiminotetrahydrofolate cyclodeaminase